MKVMKLGGGCLRDADYFRRSADIVAREKEPTAVVVSALFGVTDLLFQAIERALESEKNVPSSLVGIKRNHIQIAEALMKSGENQDRVFRRIQKKIKLLERLLFGIAYTGEVSGTVKAQVVSFGERLSAILFAGVLNETGLEAEAMDADEIGTITVDDSLENATADLDEVRRRFSESVKPLLERGGVPVITGFFGCTREGRVTTFGRNGSDYSASVIAHAIDADRLEIWKEVDGFMSADPKMVSAARRIERLSFYEAAELSYFGARILHPRTVEPLVGQKVSIFVRNLLDPDSPGTRISPRGETLDDVVKSVTFNKNIAVLRIHGPGVGFKPGIIGQIGERLSAIGVNIFSILTSQTCINLLVDKSDAPRGHDALRSLSGGVIERVDLEDHIALVAVVGEGLQYTQGIAARVFSAVSAENINVHMISSGASEVAYYFVVHVDDVEKSVASIHREFFGA